MSENSKLQPEWKTHLGIVLLWWHKAIYLLLFWLRYEPSSSKHRWTKSATVQLLRPISFQLWTRQVTNPVHVLFNNLIVETNPPRTLFLIIKPGVRRLVEIVQPQIERTCRFQNMQHSLGYVVFTTSVRIFAIHIQANNNTRWFTTKCVLQCCLFTFVNNAALST